MQPYGNIRLFFEAIYQTLKRLFKARVNLK